MPQNTTLKFRFLQAVVSGALGTVDDEGVTVTLKDFKLYFKDIKTQYSASFLPASTIEVGQCSMSRTKFVFRLRKGVYRVHPDAIEEFIKEHGVIKTPGISEVAGNYRV